MVNSALHIGQTAQSMVQPLVIEAFDHAQPLVQQAFNHGGLLAEKAFEHGQPLVAEAIEYGRPCVEHTYEYASEKAKMVVDVAPEAFHLAADVATEGGRYFFDICYSAIEMAPEVFESAKSLGDAATSKVLDLVSSATAIAAEAKQFAAPHISTGFQSATDIAIQSRRYFSDSYKATIEMVPEAFLSVKSLGDAATLRVLAARQSAAEYIAAEPSAASKVASTIGRLSLSASTAVADIPDSPVLQSALAIARINARYFRDSPREKCHAAAIWTWEGMRKALVHCEAKVDAVPHTIGVAQCKSVKQRAEQNSTNTMIGTGDCANGRFEEAKAASRWLKFW